MKFPCENYIRYLLAGGRGRWSLSDIQSHLVNLEYPQPPIEYLQTLRSRIEQVRPKPYLVGKQPNKLWLKQQELLDIYIGDAPMLEASSYLSDHDIRTVLETLLLSGVHRKAITALVQELVGAVVSDRATELYEHYYWNRDALTQTQWKEFLAECPRGKALYTCYLADPHYTLHFLGADITDLDMRTMLQRVARDAFFRLQELREYEAPNVSRSFSDYANVLLTANREMGGATTLSQLLEQVHSLGVQLQQKAVKKLSDTAISEDLILDGTLIAKIKERKKV